MSKEMTKNKTNINEEVHITYYFSVLFTILGTLSILILLHYKVESLGLFTILLAISAGGLPSGVVGAFIDYKISEYKLKSN